MSFKLRPQAMAKAGCATLFVAQIDLVQVVSMPNHSCGCRSGSTPDRCPSRNPSSSRNSGGRARHRCIGHPMQRVQAELTDDRAAGASQPG